MQLAGSYRVVRIKKILGCQSAHIEKAKGTPQQAWDYCCKEETRVDGPWSRGERPTGQGSRSDIEGAIAMIRSGKRMADILEAHPVAFVKFHRGLQMAATLLTAPRNPERAPEIHIYWGESGTGKTRKAVSENVGAYLLTKPNGNNTLWFDGYTGEDTVILDEFYGWVQYDLLLRMLDRYPLRVQTKGGTVEFCAWRFFITSNKPWDEWYPNITNLDALRRRIAEFGHVTRFRAMRAVDN